MVNKFNGCLRCEDMKNKEIKIFCGPSMLLAVSLMSSALAEETIIQQEKYPMKDA